MNVLLYHRALPCVIVLMVGWAGCAKQAEQQPAPSAEAEKEAAPAAAVEQSGEQDAGSAEPAEKAPAPRPGAAVLEAGLIRVKKCVEDHLEQLEIDQYREGNLTVDIAAMDRACKKAFEELEPESGNLLFVHKSLDEALFQARFMKDSYQRMKLYALRVGFDSAKNTKKLKGHWVATRKAAKAYSRAVDAWSKVENPPAAAEKPQRDLAVEFLGRLTKRFDAYLAKPVKAKTAIYFGVADYLDLGLKRMASPAMGFDAQGHARIKELRLILEDARAFYKEFDKASKSKKDFVKKVRKATKNLLKATADSR